MLKCSNTKYKSLVKAGFMSEPDTSFWLPAVDAALLDSEGI